MFLQFFQNKLFGIMIFQTIFFFIQQQQSVPNVLDRVRFGKIMMAVKYTNVILQGYYS